MFKSNCVLANDRAGEFQPLKMGGDLSITFMSIDFMLIDTRKLLLASIKFDTEEYDG